MGSSTTGSSTTGCTGTYLYTCTLCRNFLIIHPYDLGLFFISNMKIVDFFMFQRRDIKLQIDTKVNVLDLAEILKKMPNT